MIVRVLAGRDRHRDLVLAHEVVGHADVIEIVHFEHDVVEPPITARDSEGNRVIAVVAMHEDQPDRPLAGAKFVLDAAAHSEVSIEALGCIDVALAHDAMAESAGAGFESPMHRAAGMERFAELSHRSVKNLNRIAVGVAQLEDFEHSTLIRFVFGADAEFYPRFGQLTLYLREF